ncbi:hypothetical protein Poli38472_003503 [Pythium oligandrum]|uniref:Chitin-binding type-4 domain-containing protein n=1 Tax=Pythium oligandrum TaxID=41045 RepID=A0A8K1C7B2_PYTOL|nr:hypothetical protein Poli38472_003503 [Pythium oligandrum]|eukprot:TMW57578.1 hypothetical protein Poli38472_003503 [Pythium oligandrum]
MVHPTALLAAVALALPAAVNAHGAMSSPAPTFLDPYNKNAPSVTMAGTPGYTGLDYDLKAEVEKLGSKCGKTDPSAAPVAIPSDGVITFSISAVHIGPCAVYLGNEKVGESKNCWTDFPDKKIKVDISKCGSGCQLRWVWMATHTSPWEFYDNCVNLGSGGGSTAPTATSSAPSPASSTPAATSKAPLPSSKSPGPSTKTPRPSTTHPRPSTTTPSSTPAPSTTSTPTSAPVASGSYNYCGAARADAAALTTWCNENCPQFCPTDMCCSA